MVGISRDWWASAGGGEGIKIRPLGLENREKGRLAPQRGPKFSNDTWRWTTRGDSSGFGAHAQLRVGCGG